MNMKELEALNSKMMLAKCVEDVFGESRPTHNYINAWLKNATDFANKTKNPDLKQRINEVIQNQMKFFARWAKKQLILKTYGKKLKYPLSILLGVMSFEKQKKFCVRGTKSIVFLEKIDAVSFIGYWHQDNVILRDNDHILKEGKVVYYGTHGAQEFFHNVAPEHAYTSTLTASMFEIGNTIEIQTWAFFSIGEFLEREFR